jgi:hypothetical protein
MAPKKDDDKSDDLTWLLDSLPTVENLTRAEKARDVTSNRIAILGTRLAMLDTAIKNWRGLLKQSSAVQEPASEPKPKAEAHAHGHTVESLIRDYQTNPASPYRNKAYKTRYTTDRICQTIIDDMGDRKIAELTADYVRSVHSKWVARSAGSKRGNGDGRAMAHALLTQLRTLVNYGAKDRGDSDCVNLSFILRNIGIKVVQGNQVKSVTLDQARAVMRVAHERGLHSVALAQAFMFDCALSQKDVIGEWVPISEKGGPSEFIKDGMKWMYGLRWNQVDGNTLTVSIARDQRSLKIDLTDKELVQEELKRFNPRPSNNGPIVIDERSQLPWKDAGFRMAWRAMARAANIPDDIFNRVKTSRAKYRPNSRPTTSDQEATG